MLGSSCVLSPSFSVLLRLAIHAPHREGDQRNHHAHILTATRVLSAEGLTDKTRILEAASTGGPEIEAMRGFGPSCKTTLLNWQAKRCASIIGLWRCSAKRRCP